MTTQTITTQPVRTDVAREQATPAGRRAGTRWALAGVLAGIAGVGVVVTTTMVDGVYDKDLAGHPDLIADRIAGQTGAMFAFHALAVATALLLVVHAAGLFGRIRATSGVGTAGVVALSGWLGTAFVLVMGSSWDTEYMTSLTAGGRDGLDDFAIASYNHWIGTVPWVWVLAGLSGLALHAVARDGGVPRWIGRVGLVLGGLTCLLGISPLEYMAVVPAVLMLLTTSLGFLVGDKSFRAGA
jgi:hypothetical protein